MPQGPASRGPGSRVAPSRVTWFQRWHHLRGPGYTAVTNGHSIPNSRGGPLSALPCPGQVTGSSLCSHSGLMWLYLHMSFLRSRANCVLALNAPSWKWQMPRSFMSHWPKQATIKTGLTVHSMLLLLSHRVVSDSLRPCGLQHTRPLSLTIFQSLPKFMSIGTGDALQPSHPVSPSSPSDINLSQHQGLSQ